MSTTITALSTVPQASTYTRLNEKILTVTLVIAILAIGSLFSVAKTVGSRVLGYRVNENPCRGEVRQKREMSKAPHGLNTARDSTSASDVYYPNLEDRMPDSESRHIQPKCPSPQLQLPISLLDRDRNHAAGLRAIHAWEDSTIERIQRQKARKLNQSQPLDDDCTSRKTQEIYAILAWEKATMRRFQQEKVRRLMRLSSMDRQEASPEAKLDKDVRAWERAAEREGAYEKGLQSIGDWELSQERRLRSRSVTGKERRVDAEDEDDGRVILWKAGAD